MSAGKRIKSAYKRVRRYRRIGFKHLFCVYAQILPVSAWRALLKNEVKVASGGKRQILVDVSGIIKRDAHTGIQRVVRGILMELLAAPPQGYDIKPVYATNEHGYCYAPESWPDRPVEKLGAHDRIQAGAGDVFLGLDLSSHLLYLNQPQLMMLKRRGMAVHIVIYDLLPLQYPQWFTPQLHRRFKRWIKAVARMADGTASISASTRDSAQAWFASRFGLKDGDIDMGVIPLASDIENTAPSSGIPADAPEFLRKMKDCNSVLMVGTVEPRKGYAQALAAFEEMWSRGREDLLVIVGRPGWKTKNLQDRLGNHPEQGKRLHWLRDVSDEYLVKLYAASRGLLMASEAEGFGLPLIEANRHGKHVLARDIPVFREIMGDAATYFADGSPSRLAEVIEGWVDSTSQTPPADCPFHGIAWTDTVKGLGKCLKLDRYVSEAA